MISPGAIDAEDRAEERHVLPSEFVARVSFIGVSTSRGWKFYHVFFSFFPCFFPATREVGDLTASMHPR